MSTPDHQTKIAAQIMCALISNLDKEEIRQLIYKSAAQAGPFGDELPGNLDLDDGRLIALAAQDLAYDLLWATNETDRYDS